MILDDYDPAEIASQTMLLHLLVQMFEWCTLIVSVIILNHIDRPRIPSRRFSLANLKQSHKSLFRCEVEEFDILHHELRLRTTAHDHVLSTDALHIVLWWFAFPCYWSDLCKLFHRSGPAPSRIFHCALARILDHYAQLLIFNPKQFQHLLAP